MPALRLIVGLGNPGPQYTRTRHNAGFWLLDRVAHEARAAWRHDSKSNAELVRTTYAGTELWLMKPQTFMNRSGQAVVAHALYYKILPDEILVVHDELDLQPGTVRMKRGGGSGGHNGLKDITQRLATPDYWRLRLGIGHPGDRNAVIDYVLHVARAEEEDLILEAIDRSLAVLPTAAQGKFEVAMHKLHTRPRPDKPTDPNPSNGAPNP